VGLLIHSELGALQPQSYADILGKLGTVCTRNLVLKHRALRLDF